MHSNHRKKNNLLRNVLMSKINLRKTRSWKIVKESWLSILLVAKQTVHSNPGIDLNQVQGKNKIMAKFIPNTGQNFPGILLLKNVKMGLSRLYKYLPQEPQKLRKICSRFRSFSKEDPKGGSLLKTTTKLDQNCTMVIRHWRTVLI